MGRHPQARRPLAGEPRPEVFFAPCPRGLEEVLRAELAELGARDPVPAEGGVGFTGPFELAYRVNLESRIASRVLWRLAEGPYRGEDDLYRAARDQPWPSWFARPTARSR